MILFILLMTLMLMVLTMIMFWGEQSGKWQFFSMLAGPIFFSYAFSEDLGLGLLKSMFTYADEIQHAVTLAISWPLGMLSILVLRKIYVLANRYLKNAGHVQKSSAFKP